MARDHGRVYASIWDDDDFTSLPPGPQRLYLFLITQADLSQAGLIAKRLRRWATRSADTTADQLEHDLQALADARFVVVDHDTEEVLVRTFIRNDKVWRQPNVMKAAVKAAREILSPRLRTALADEVALLDVDDLSDVARGSSPSPRDVVATCIGTLLAYLTDGSGNPSGTLPTRVPETLSVRVSPSPTPTPSTSMPPADRATGAVEATQTDDGAVSTGHADAPQADEAPRGSDARTAPSSPDPVLDTAEQLAAITGRPIEDVVLAGTTEHTAQTLLAQWIDNCGARPPSRVIGHVARELKTMLNEGIPADDVGAGLVAWHHRGLHPSALASVVHETRTAGQRQRSTTDQRVADGLALAARFAANETPAIGATA